ncbi:MAG: pseudouridine synthase [Acutalibacteraceae bacterium]
MALVRLQKLLSERGVASRRGAEELIAAGKVKVNGRVAALGDKADDRRDVVTVCGKKLEKAEMPTYLMLNKPRGYVTTMQDEQGRKCVADLVKSVGARVYPVGRLDRDSEGLLLMTNDGDFANAVMHPSRHIPKYYRVTLRGQIKDEQLALFQKGIEIDGRNTAPAQAVVVLSQPERTVIEVVLTEGRNRQIRRICEASGLEVIRLRRTAIGPVRLGMLKVGDWRHLTPEEVRNLLVETHTKQKIAAAYIKNGRSVLHDRDRSRR